MAFTFLDGICFIPVLAVLHHGDLLSPDLSRVYASFGDALCWYYLFFHMAIQTVI